MISVCPKMAFRHSALLLLIAIVICKSSKVHKGPSFSDDEVESDAKLRLSMPVPSPNLACLPIGRTPVFWCQLNFNIYYSHNQKTAEIATGGSSIPRPILPPPPPPPRYVILKGEELACFGKQKYPFATEFFFENPNGQIVQGHGINLTITSKGKNWYAYKSHYGPLRYDAIPRQFEVAATYQGKRQVCLSIPPPDPCVRAVIVSCCILYLPKVGCLVLFQVIRNRFCKYQFVCVRKDNYYREPANIHISGYIEGKVYNEDAKIVSGDNDNLEYAVLNSTEGTQRLVDAMTDFTVTYMPKSEFPYGHEYDPYDGIVPKSRESKDASGGKSKGEKPAKHRPNKKKPRFCRFSMPNIKRLTKY